jgi:hypothetical protein
MNLTTDNRAATDSIPDSLLQTVGIMKNALRSIRYIEKRLSDTMEWTELDPRLRTEMHHLRGATSEMMFRLSMMGTVVADLLKDAEKDLCSDTNRLGEAKRDQDQGRKGCNRLEIVRAATR